MAMKMSSKFERMDAAGMKKAAKDMRNPGGKPMAKPSFVPDMRVPGGKPAAKPSAAMTGGRSKAAVDDRRTARTKALKAKLLPKLKYMSGE